MAAIGFVLFFAFVACIVGIFGLLSNCLFEFGVEPAVKRCIAWRKACENEKMVKIYVKNPTDKQIRIACEQMRIEFGESRDKFDYEWCKELLKASDESGCFGYLVRKDAELPDNFVEYAPTRDSL